MRFGGVRESIAIDIVSWFGYTSLGMFAFLLIFVICRDLVYSAGSLVLKLVRRMHPPQQEDLPNAERRRFLIHSSNLGIIGLAAGVSGYGFFEARHGMQTEHAVIPLPHLPASFEGFRIVQFTDTHVGPTVKRDFIEKVVAYVQNLNPDLIVFTGDLVDGSVAWLEHDVEPLKELSAPYGKFFITGNHEYYSGALPWIEHADKLGFTVLLNEHRLIQRGGAQIVLAGVTDYTAGEYIATQVSDPVKALSGAPAGLVKILLAHQPRSIYAASPAGYDLQLSGHTHGGQFIPWNYLATLNQPYIKGLFKHENMYIYVSRGTGYWGPPIRLGIPPEITLITLTGKA
jgi:predicted MPP superfamily phosphohydrolase